MSNPKVVIVGGGFGGLNAAKALGKVPVDLTLVDRTNYHLFQPLLYQVATAGLSSVDIAAPIRHVLKDQPNTEVLMAEVTRIGTADQRVFLKDQDYISYDYLILAPGSHYNYFGKDEWEKDAPSLKTIPDALEIRRKVLSAFERAEMESDAEKRRACLNFVVVGGGPTGVELAGSLAELAHRVLAKDFRRINPASARILLVEAGPKILAPFPESLALKAKRRLEKMGVEIRENTKVENIGSRGAQINGQLFPAHTVLWCAGVQASPLLESLGVPLERGGRVLVQPDLSLKEYPNIFVLGDAAQFQENGKPLPGLAPVAIQQGRHVAKVIRSRMKEERSAPIFRYYDKGQLATLGRGFAIAHIGKLKASGWVGWLLWAFVHILYLVGFQNRAMVLFQWSWQYFSFDRGARVIPTKHRSRPDPLE